MQGLRIAIAVVVVNAECGSAFVPSIPYKTGVNPSVPQQSHLMDTQRISEVAVEDAMMPESSVLSEVSCHWSLEDIAAIFSGDVQFIQPQKEKECDMYT